MSAPTTTRAAPAAPVTSARPAPRSRRRPAAGTVASGLLLWGYAAVALLPLLLMLSGAFRQTPDILDDPLGLPTTLDTSNFRQVWSDSSFPTYLLNSVVVTVGGVVLGTVVSVLAAYPLGRWRFRGAGLLTAFFLSGLMLPIRLGILPVFYLLQSLGLVDSRIGLILLYGASGVPFCVFVLIAFFRQVPAELEDAARVDGAGELRTFRSVMLPMVRPAVATVAIFQFVPLWNDFFFPLVLLRDDSKATVQVGLTRFFGEYQADWGVLFAGLLLAALPLVVLFVLATKQVVAGLTAGMGK